MISPSSTSETEVSEKGTKPKEFYIIKGEKNKSVIIIRSRKFESFKRIVSDKNDSVTVLCAQRKITMIKWMWGEESGWIIWPCFFIKQHWPLVKLVRIIQRVICIMLVCMRVWIHLSMRIMKLCAIFLYECVSVAGCVCICVFFMCVCVCSYCMYGVHVLSLVHICTIVTH